MEKNKIFLLGILFLFLIFFLSLASAAVCCEKTIYGAYCQMESDESKCSSEINEFTGQPYLNAPTFCEMTSYCKLGVCVDVKEGFCHQNTPRTTCEKEGGSWYDQELEELTQCSLGCCYLGDEAAFVTQTRCKTLSSLHNLETDFRSDITDAFLCVASAQPYVKGACVIETDEGRDCLMLTREKCQDREASSSTIEFHEGILCSADFLATNCGPRGGTKCEDEKVYFQDTCHQTANVYDYSRINDADYWTYIQEPTCSETESKNSRTCGNCAYSYGSVCKAVRENPNSAGPYYGEYICGSLDCQDHDFQQAYGRDPLHGEVWCVITTAEGIVDELSNFLPGSQHYRFKCVAGEVIPDPCEPSRETICNQTQSSIGMQYAQCELNQWENCIGQETQEDCEDREKGDCQWIEGLSIIKEEDGMKEKLLENEDGQMKKASCVPLYPPTSSALCEAASVVWILNYTYGALANKNKLESSDPSDREWAAKKCEDGSDGTRDDWKKSTSGCYALIGHEDHWPWAEAAADVCRYLGDCGVDINYIGKWGENDEYVVYGEIQG